MNPLMLGALISTALNLVLFAGLPLLAYFAYHRLRHGRSFDEVRRRAGLQPSPSAYLWMSALVALVAVAALIVWPPPLEPLLRRGSPQRVFRGLGLGMPAVALALLHGVLKTGFAEELLFRGLIAGSLARRLRVTWANLLQALVFLAPHAFAVAVMPELAGVLPLIFAGALFAGWVRIRSGSILGPWLLHAVLNFTMCLSVSMRTAP